MQLGDGMSLKPSKKQAWLGKLLIAVLVIVVVLWFAIAMTRLGTGQAQEGREQLETALRRAAVACYAAEGVYPPTLDYITEHYGIQIDNNRYRVFYEIFAENIMPEITVLDKNV